MHINTSKDNNKLIIAVDGRLDTTTAPELDKIIKSSLSGINDLTFDFSKLEYISSAGLRELLSAQKVMNAQGSMIIKGSNDDIKEIFEITGFSEILTVE